MSGTVSGGKKAAAKNLAKDPDFYKRIGRLGGQVKGTSGGFAAKITCFCDEFETAHPHMKCAGKRGGRTSRRPKAVAHG